MVLLTKVIMHIEHCTVFFVFAFCCSKKKGVDFCVCGDGSTHWVLSTLDAVILRSPLIVLYCILYCTVVFKMCKGEIVCR